MADPLPQHIAIIMDGNGRWAERQGLPRIEGHRRGVASVRRTVEECARLGIGQLTLYCLSSENWKRPPAEIDFETARTRARQADEALANNENWGPLHGLPMTIKDYINVTGFHTTYGSPIFKDYLPTTNADVVQPLIDAGAIVFGKSNLPLWASNSCRP